MYSGILLGRNHAKTVGKCGVKTALVFRYIFIYIWHVAAQQRYYRIKHDKTRLLTQKDKNMSENTNYWHLMITVACPKKKQFFFKNILVRLYLNETFYNIKEKLPVF